MGGLSNPEQRKKLQSWKEIAAFLGKDVRTARRWSLDRGLPVHRVPGGKGASVFAYSDELDEWLNQSSEVEGAPSEVETESGSTPGPSSANGDSAEVIVQPLFPAQKEIQSGAPHSTTPPKPVGRATHWGIVLGLLGVLATGSFLIGTRLPHDKSPAQVSGNLPRRFMLAVLPFTNLSGDSAQQYFSDGLTEELITQISRLNPRGLGVIARTSAMSYRDTNKGAAQIGRELGVDYIVEGSLRLVGTRARITAQLIRTSDQTHLWANSYDRDLGDILKLEEEVSHSIAGEIRIQLKPGDIPGSASSRPINAEAYEAYLKGRYFFGQRHRTAVEKSIEYYRQAVEKDPNYALAYAGMADSYILLGLFSVPTVDVMPKAKSAAARAIELDNSLPEAHTSLAGVLAMYDWDWRGAEREFKVAMNLDPSYATAHHWYATLYCAPLGLKQEAVEHMRIAEKLDPLSPIIVTDLGWAYFLAGQTDQAIAQYRKALDLEPAFVTAVDRLTQAYLKKGAYKEALDMMDFNPEFPDDIAAVMQTAYRRSGYPGALQAELAMAIKRKARGEASDPYSFAFLYASLGQNDRALENLQEAYDERYPGLIYMNVDPPFEAMRGNPRFQAMERRVGLIP